MKFNCGPTPKEKRAAREAAENEWHLVFAWRPMRFERECRWLEYVDRRRKWYDHGTYKCSYDEWEYRAR